MKHIKYKILIFFLGISLVLFSFQSDVSANVDYNDYDSLIQSIAKSIILKSQDRNYTKEEIAFISNPWNYVQTASQFEINQLLANGDLINTAVNTASNLNSGSNLLNVAISLSSEQSVFNLGELPKANFTVVNNSGATHTYTINTFVRSDIMPVSHIQEYKATLEAGAKYDGEIVASRILDLYESGKLTFMVDVTKQRYTASANLDVFIKTNPKLNLQVNFSDKNNIKKKVFYLNQPIEGIAITKAPTANLSVVISEPDGNKLNFTTNNFQFIPKQTGIYKVEAAAWQTGYTPSLTKYKLAVISEASDAQSVNYLSSNSASTSVSSDVNIESTTSVNNTLYNRLKGHILLAVEDSGKLYYVGIDKPAMYYLGDPRSALAVMREQSIGINNYNLSRFKLGNTDIAGLDDDNDGLANVLESSLGSSPDNPDTDGDGFTDYDEILSGYDPISSGRLPIDNIFSANNAGKFFLQVENNGEVYYISPKDNKRYYLPNPATIREAVANIVTGINNSDLSKLINELK